MDDERLKNPPVSDSGVPDYFDEMLERIRDIRASERRMYLRVKEIFAMAGDYDPSWSETTKFFSVIQNKLHFAATGMTAAELIRQRADHTLPNMGLTAWKTDEVRKTDVTIAKNYLNETEIDELNRIVVMWLDFAEDQARRRKQVFMQGWTQKLDDFLAFNERSVLPNAGSVKKKTADEHARQEYAWFEVRRREYKESLGEAESIKVLEETAKVLEGGMTCGKLSQNELESLGRIVNVYLELAEGRARRRIPMTMEDWAKRLDRFLEFDEREILQDSGKVTADIARHLAESEFEKYRIVQDRLLESDFDRALKGVENKPEDKE